MNLVKINPDHYVVVDDSEIKESDYLYSFSNKKVVIANKLTDLYVHSKKITHSTQPLESLKIDSDVANIRYVSWGDIKYLPFQEVKELLGEVDVEKMAEEYADFSNDHVTLAFGEKFNITTKRDYLAGYNQALEDNKEKKYTEEDMKVAITQAFLSGVERLEDFERVQEMILDNIKPKTEWQVEFVDGKLKLK